METPQNIRHEIYGRIISCYETKSLKAPHRVSSATYLLLDLQVAAMELGAVLGNGPLPLDSIRIGDTASDCHPNVGASWSSTSSESCCAVRYRIQVTHHRNWILMVFRLHIYLPTLAEKQIPVLYYSLGQVGMRVTEEGC